ncbi:MAG: hypothetical protein SNG38_08345 [Rikenellaceae bacterium]
MLYSLDGWIITPQRNPGRILSLNAIEAVKVFNHGEKGGKTASFGLVTPQQQNSPR